MFYSGFCSTVSTTTGKPRFTGIHYRNGFTLIEVMVVIAIIGVMAAIVTPKLLAQPDIARYNAAKASIKKLSAAIELYALQEQSLPSSERGLSALVAPGPESGNLYPATGYIDKDDLLDPWGNAWVYRTPGENGPFDLISYGKDGVPGGEGLDSDLTN